MFSRQVHFVSGKGGVGKSTIACALALQFSRAGQKTLLVELGGATSYRQYFTEAKNECSPNKIADSLWAISLNPEDCRREYLLKKLHGKTWVDLFLKNKLVSSFFKFVPGLDELNMLGKVWYLAEEGYDKIVVDLPASGHAYRFLTVAGTAYKTLQRGPVAKEALKIADFVSNSQRTCLHIVSLPNELSVSEALGLEQRILDEKICDLGILYLNQVHDFGLRETGLKKHEDKGSIGDMIRHYSCIERLERKELDRLERKSSMTQKVIVPKLRPGFNLLDIESLF